MSSVVGVLRNDSKHAHVHSQKSAPLITQDNPKIVHVARFKMAPLSKEDMHSKQLKFLEKKIQINEEYLKQSAQMLGIFIGSAIGGMSGAGISYYFGLADLETLSLSISFMISGGLLGYTLQTVNAVASLRAWNDQYKSYVKKLDDSLEGNGLRHRKVQSRKTKSVE
jgi:hypothetical protein